MRKEKQTGQSLVEYVALTALVAIVSIGTVKMFGGKVRSRLNQITNTFDKNVQYGLRTKDNDNDDVSEDVRVPKNITLPGGLKLPLPR